MKPTPGMRLTVVLAIVFIISVIALPAAAAHKIAVLVSSDDPPFEEALAGFRDYLAKQGIQAEYAVHRIAGNVQQAELIAQEVKKDRANLVFALGSLGTQAATRSGSSVPLVSCLVLRSSIFAGAPNTTGVELEFPVETQFNWLKKILPDAKKIGVLYNSRENKKRVEHARRIASDMGLAVEAVEIRSAQDVPSALAHLANSVDAIWGLADSLTLAAPVAKHMLLFAFRNKIPFIGPSEAWVKAGALYSLTWDYRDLGSQCGAMAYRILRGAAPDEIPPASPRKVHYSLNQNTAEQIKIFIPESVLLKAREIY